MHVPVICLLLEYWWDVRQYLVRQFKTIYVRLLEGLVFEEKKTFVTDKPIETITI
jgi:hypothetical protein